MKLAVEIVNLSKSYILNNKELKVLENVNLKAEEGKFVSIIGPSGCGKSTLFRTIAGLESDYDGFVAVNGMRVMITEKLKDGDELKAYSKISGG